MTDILVTQSGRVTEITINRADKRNALTHAMYRTLSDALHSAATDAQVRCVIITGVEDVFSAGNDLDDFTSGMPAGKPPVLDFLDALVSFEKPLIAAVNGIAVGIGLTMLLHCDLVFAAENATLRAPFAQVGLVPEAGSSMLLPRAVGMAWAGEIFLAGRELSALQARDIGLLTRVLAPAQLLPEARTVAAEIAALAPDAVRHSKALMRQGKEALIAHMRTETKLFAGQLASDEFRVSVKAYLRGQRPNFD